MNELRLLIKPEGTISTMIREKKIRKLVRRLFILYNS